MISAPTSDIQAQEQKKVHLLRRIPEGCTYAGLFDVRGNPVHHEESDRRELWESTERNYVLHFHVPTIEGAVIRVYGGIHQGLVIVELPSGHEIDEDEPWIAEDVTDVAGYSGPHDLLQFVETREPPAELSTHGEANLDTEVARIRSDIDRKTMNPGTKAYITVGGASGSGKSGLVSQKLDDERNIVSTDNYYWNTKTMFALLKDAGVLDEENYDLPVLVNLGRCRHHVRELLAGNTVQMPEVDFTQGGPKPEETPFSLEERRRLVLEGIFASTPSLKEAAWDIEGVIPLPLFVGAGECTTILRRIVRDVKRTRQSPVAIMRQLFGTVFPAQKRYVDPTANDCTILHNPYCQAEHKNLPTVRKEKKFRLPTDSVPECINRMNLVQEAHHEDRFAYLSDKQGKGFVRVRKETQDGSPDQFSFMYKSDARVRGGTREHSTLEFDIEERDWDDMRKNAQMDLSLNKTRKVYTSPDIPLRVCLDEVTCGEKNLGTFLEVQATRDIQDEDFDQYIADLGLGEYEVDERTYVDIAMAA